MSLCLNPPPNTFFFFFPSKVHEGSQLLLSACLSCDGCVSEEESLKISQQSLEEVERILALNKVQCATKLPLEAEKVREMSCVTLPYIVPIVSLSLSEVRRVETQGAGSVDMSTVSAFLCRQVRCGHH